jgi:isopentenyl-diphosphate delta-isomerase
MPSGADRGDHRTGADELVVLLDQSGRPRGTAPKAGVHHDRTPLHLAFSCWVTDGRGRTLITRRAWSKRTWPGVWTNAFCGHPAPGEALPDAVRRRARQELGAAITEPTPALPLFRYRATMANGVVENEVCPVFLSELLQEPDPAPDEVAEVRWMAIDELHHRLERDRRWFSPWAARQLVELAATQPSFADRTADRPRPPRLEYRNLLRHRGPGRASLTSR